MNREDAPEVKSNASDVPKAGSAGQPPDVRGLQEEYVCAMVESMRYEAVAAKAAKNVVTRMLETNARSMGR